MSTRILFKNDDGGVSVLIPTAQALSIHTVQEIAEKDVPAGKPYKIIDAADVPSDRSLRDAWTVNEADLTDGVGGQYDVFITDPAHPNYVAPTDGGV